MTTINSQEDFLRALSENPEWRAAVRAQILGEEQLQLPVRFDAFVEQVAGFIDEQKQFNAEMRLFNTGQRELRNYLKRECARPTAARDKVPGVWIPAFAGMTARATEDLR